MDRRKAADDFARTNVTQARMERAYASAGGRMGVFVKHVVDDVMRDSAVLLSDPALEVAATQAVAAVAAKWISHRTTRPA